MAYRKATLRKLPPVTRKVAKLLNELESIHRKLRNALPQIEGLERWHRADLKRRATLEAQDVLGTELPEDGRPPWPEEGDTP